MTTPTRADSLDLHTATSRIELIDARTFRCNDLIVAHDGPLLPALHRSVYTCVYLGGSRSRPDPVDRRLADAREDPNFVAALRAANSGRRWWDSGWRHRGAAGGDVLAVSHRDNVQLRCTVDEVRPSEASAGDEIEVALPTERRFVSPGFYLTDGLAGGPERGADVLRWYLNVPAGGAARLLHQLITLLDAASLPFSVKTLNDPAVHPRPDALVLFTDRRHTGTVARVVDRSLRRSAVLLRDPVPAFTRRLGSGFAIADEPTDRSLSFGLHRSLLLAQGVLEAGAAADLPSRWSAVAGRFRRAGLDPARPHLGAGRDEPDLDEGESA